MKFIFNFHFSIAISLFYYKFPPYKSLHLSYLSYYSFVFLSFLLPCTVFFCFVLTCLVLSSSSLLFVSFSFPSISFSKLLSHIDGRALSFPWRDAQRIILLWNSKSRIIIRGTDNGSDKYNIREKHFASSRNHYYSPYDDFRFTVP